MECEKNRNIRMIGLDLDGTVFNDEKKITAHTKEVLAAAIRRGIVVLPATGRPQSGLPEDSRGALCGDFQRGGELWIWKAGKRSMNAGCPGS